MRRAGRADPAASSTMPRNRACDCIVIGGGRNGLIAAAYLAKAGRSVCVLERPASHPGGGVMGACGRNAAGEILRDLGQR